MLESAGLIGTLIVLFLLVLLIFIVAATSIRIVSPYQKGVVERLGRYHHTAQPGLNFVMPFRGPRCQRCSARRWRRPYHC